MFGSVQSLSQMDLSGFHPDAFDIVIVDEFHRAGAPTYRELLGRLQPEGAARPDGDTRTHRQRRHPPLLRRPHRAEMRLWDALERNLLCPFQYFGLHDNADLSQRALDRGRATTSMNLKSSTRRTMRG